MKKRYTPTRTEIAQIRRLEKAETVAASLREKMERDLCAKYAPCKVGDLIEGGKIWRDRGYVTEVEGWLSKSGYHLRVFYLPVRGKQLRKLKTARWFTCMENIRVLQSATA